ncbi:NAD-dependent epimerase/dehydratase family protein [Natrialba taiwanensis]|uniref:NAD-dependent epimerase/dehydratase n=1 Tax=Natrialba taiwanensis DSM 12281 TaxID=1230458 RepID=M0A0A9_9EURY|nr:NAD(P)-dependent oxidoreductase [Natrialba taiwanensis]ELY92195.1 NAD-dependent epimerase/dehydratase [Natrialba taiwanensis DSM 12281]
MDVLVTGSYGRCGTAIIDHLHDDDRYEFTYYNRSGRDEDDPYGGYETVIGDIADYETLREACTGQDAIVHLAAYPYTDGDWSDIFEPNVIGMYNVLEAAREAEVDSVIFGSTNHVMGQYEQEFAPDIYDRQHELVLDHTDPVRPDSYYGASKSFGEDLGRYYVEDCAYPNRFYALRICSVRMPEYDHPYGDAEAGVENGEWERGSPEYEREVARMKATWQSRRDFAHQIECCLADERVEFDIFSGVSDNRRRWFDLEHARSVLGYDPQDDGEEWDAPPESVEQLSQ